MNLQIAQNGVIFTIIHSHLSKKECTITLLALLETISILGNTPCSMLGISKLKQISMLNHLLAQNGQTLQSIIKHTTDLVS